MNIFKTILRVIIVVLSVSLLTELMLSVGVPFLIAAVLNFALCFVCGPWVFPNLKKDDHTHA